MNKKEISENGTDTNSGRMTIKRVFVLSASSNQGKTTTLNKLAVFLANQTGWRQTDGPNPPLQGAVDSQYVFERKDGLRVGISTAGDGPSQIIGGFTYFNQYKCDVCFIASKSWGASIKQIEIECASVPVVPQYQYLPGEYNKRVRNQVQADVVQQLFNMI